MCGHSKETSGRKAKPSDSAATPAGQRAVDELAYAADVPENLRKAIRQVLFDTIKLPITDGYGRSLRHQGHNMNAAHGPLKIFITADFADVYSPILVSMIGTDGDGNPISEQANMRWPANLAKQGPEMHTLQSMHCLVAQHPRKHAKFCPSWTTLWTGTCFPLETLCRLSLQKCTEEPDR